MARFRRGLKRKRSFKRKRYRKYGERKFNKRVKRAVTKFAEKRYVDNSQSLEVFGSDGQFLYFNNGISQGDGPTLRQGSQIYARSLRLYGHFVGNNSSTGTEYQFRVIVGCWTQFPSGAPTATQLLTGSSGFWHWAQYNRQTLQQKRWIPMFDKRFTVTRPNGNDPMSSCKFFDWKFSGKRLPMKRVTFDGTNAADHVYFLWFFQDQTNIAGARPGLEMTARFTYTDV